MKIKATQFDNKTRESIANAVQLYGASLSPYDVENRKKFSNISTQIRHGELILCRYIYDSQEGGDV